MTTAITTPLLKDLNKLIFDPDFISLNRQSVFTSLLELKPFKETEISRVLAWLIDPNEGHMQGDYFLKSMIAAVYQEADETQLTELPTASHMSILSLANISVMQEVAIKQSKDRRMDILLADAASKTIIVLERKDGSKASTGQLEDYYNWTQKNYPGWNKIFVLSDSYQKCHGQNDHVSFVQLNDSWLANALMELINQNTLSSKAICIFKDIHDFVFGEWCEKRDSFYTGRESRIKQIANTHSEIIRALEDEQLKIGSKYVSYIDITPTLYFTAILPDATAKPNKYTDEQLTLASCVQSYHNSFSSLHGYNEFDQFGEIIMNTYPEFWIAVHKDLVWIALQKHVTDDETYLPYYMEISRNESKDGEDVTYNVSIGASKKSIVTAHHIADEFAELNNFKVTVNWRSREKTITSDIKSLSLKNGSELSNLIADFHTKTNLLSNLRPH